MSWLAITAPFLVGLLVVFIPGLMVAAALKMRGIDAFGIAPALSVAMVAISAIVAPMMGVRWALWVPFAFAALIALLGFLIQRGVDALGGRRRHSDQPVAYSDSHDAVASRAAGSSLSPLAESRWFSREQALYWVSFAVGAILLARNVTNSVGRPEWISQTYDANFHLNALRYVVDHGNGSSLFIASMTSGNETPDFYPAAWHDLGSLMFMATGVSIPVVTNALVVLIGAVIWPISLIFFARHTLNLNKFGILALGPLAAAFVAFPYLLLNFGVLYPNLLALSITPVGLAVVAQMFRLAMKTRMTVTQTIFLGLFIALGIAIAHPNAMMSLLVLLIPIFVTRGLLQLKAAVQGLTSWIMVILQIAGIAGILWLISYLWGIVRPPKESGGWEPSASQSQSFGEFITNGIMGWPSLWFVTILMACGIYALIRTRNRSLWLLGSFGVLCWFYMAARYLTWDEGRDWVVGVWYHDAYRIAAMLPMLMIPLGALGIDFLTRWVSSSTWLESAIASFRRRGSSSVAVGDTLRSSHTPTVASLVLAVLLTGVLIWGGQTAKPLEKYIHDTFWTYAPEADSALLTPDEYNVLDHIDDYVPEGDAVIVQPWTGAALTYAVSGREVNAYHTNFVDTPQTDMVDLHLKDWQSNSAVCPALESLDAKYVVDFGTQEILNADHSIRYAGLMGIKDTPGFKEVYKSGNVGLYEITACE